MAGGGFHALEGQGTAMKVTKGQDMPVMSDIAQVKLRQCKG